MKTLITIFAITFAGVCFAQFPKNVNILQKPDTNSIEFKQKKILQLLEKRNQKEQKKEPVKNQATRKETDKNLTLNK